MSDSYDWHFRCFSHDGTFVILTDTFIGTLSCVLDVSSGAKIASGVLLPDDDLSTHLDGQFKSLGRNGEVNMFRLHTRATGDRPLHPLVTATMIYNSRDDKWEDRFTVSCPVCGVVNRLDSSVVEDVRKHHRERNRDKSSVQTNLSTSTNSVNATEDSSIQPTGVESKPSNLLYSCDSCSGLMRLNPFLCDARPILESWAEKSK